jgi:iron(III) transport system permease protein
VWYLRIIGPTVLMVLEELDMRWLRGVRRVASGTAIALMFAPLAAVLASSLFDRLPAEGLRATAFPAALAIWDPFVWLGIGHSLTAALLIAAGSFVFGILLGNFTARWRVWGQSALVALALAPLVMPPVVGAVGLRSLLDGGWPALTRWSPNAPGWLAWIWIGWIRGVPWVALSTRAVFCDVDRAWEEIARGEGAPPARVWWGLIWPLVRPPAAAAAGAVFAISLLDPAVPLVFGLRRTLAFQIVDSAVGPSIDMPRAATLAILGASFASIGRGLSRLRSRTRFERREPPGSVHAHPANLRTSTAIVAFLLVWTVFAWTPARLAWIEATRGGSAAIGVAGRGGSLDSLAAQLEDPEVRELISTSLKLGGFAAIAALAVALLGERSEKWLGRLGRVPPLAMGVGALALPYLLFGVAEGLTRRSGTVRFDGLRELASGLDPYGAPGVLLVWVLAATFIPVMVAALAPYRGRIRAQRIEMAVTLGATTRRAERTVIWPVTVPALLRSFLATTLLAVTNLTPALLLVPTSQARTAGPGVLVLCDQPGGLARACALGLAMFGFNIVAWLVLAPKVMRQSGAGLLS